MLTPDPRVALPATLRSRLLSIPAVAPPVGCSDVERLYEASLANARGGRIDAGAEQHFAACRRCRAIYGVLGVSFRELSLPLPRRLLRRLRSVVERPRRLPFFARDRRLALAASALMTASLMLVLGDPVSLFRTTADTVSSRVTVLAEAGEEHSQQLLESMADGFERRWESGREAWAETRYLYDKLRHEARDLDSIQQWRRLFESSTLEGE